MMIRIVPGPKIGDDGKLVEHDGEKEYAFQKFDVSEGSFWREALRKFRSMSKETREEGDDSPKEDCDANAERRRRTAGGTEDVERRRRGVDGETEDSEQRQRVATAQNGRERYFEQQQRKMKERRTKTSV